MDNSDFYSSSVRDGGQVFPPVELISFVSSLISIHDVLRRKSLCGEQLNRKTIFHKPWSYSSKMNTNNKLTWVMFTGFVSG